MANSRDVMDPEQSPNPRVTRALATVEEVAGGREGLISQLTSAPLTPQQEFLVGLIADPANDRKSLATICGMANVGVGQFLSTLRDVKMARATLAAMDRVATYLPAVAEDVMARAVPHDVPCAVCNGTGKVKTKVVRRGRHAEEVEIACATCNGRGATPVLPALDRQKFALALGNLPPHEPGGVRVGVQVNTNYPYPVGNTVAFRGETDAVLAETTEPTAESGEGEAR